MKTVFSLIIFLLVSVVAKAQRYPLNQGCTIGKNYYAEIPYEIVAGEIMVYPEINGKKLRFLFDTGAPVQITPELLSELKLPVINSMHIIDANGSIDSLNIVDLPAINLNNAVFSTVPALVAGSDLYKCWHIDGVIGSNILRNSIVRFDTKKHVIILTDDEKRLQLDKKTRATLLTDDSQSAPYVVVWLKGKKTLLAQFDTGDADFLTLTEKDMKRFAGINVFEKLAAGYGSGHRSLFGLQKPDSTYLLKFPSIHIGGCEFNNATTETNKTNTTRLGVKMLDHGIVTLDFIHHSFYFEPDSDKINLEKKKWPLQAIMDADKLIVGIVWTTINGEVQAGDQILAIDDVSYANVQLCDILGKGALVLKDKQSAVITLKDKSGVVRKVTIKKE